MSYITNVHSLTDGFGETLKFVILSIFFADLTGSIFHYTPFQPTMEHNYDQDPLFLSKKESMMGFYKIFPLSNPTFFAYSPLSKFSLLHYFEMYGDRLLISPSFQKCKQVFFEGRGRPRATPYAAIHIRRMNVLDKSRSSKMIEGCDVPEYIYVQIIELIRKFDPKLEIHIFSQGSKEDFELLSSIFNIHWHLEETVESTFLDMAFADLLVVAPSALSYTAALYSNSKHIWFIQSEVFRPLPHWCPVLGYQSTRKHQFFTKTPTGRVDLHFDAKQNRFFTKEGKEFFF